jgi:hypothetical protein
MESFKDVKPAEIINVESQIYEYKSKGSSKVSLLNEKIEKVNDIFSNKMDGFEKKIELLTGEKDSRQTIISNRLDINRANSALTKAIKFLVEIKAIKLSFNIDEYDDSQKLDREKFFDIIDKNLEINRGSFTQTFSNVFLKPADFEIVLRSFKEKESNEPKAEIYSAILMLTDEFEKSKIITKDWNAKDVLLIFLSTFMIYTSGKTHIYIYIYIKGNRFFEI